MKKTELLLDRVEREQCHDMASQFIIKAAQAEILTSDTKPAISPPKPTIPRRRKSSGSHGSGHLPSNPRRYSGQLDDKLEPELQMMRSLGISLPVGCTPDQSRTKIIEKTLSDRMAKLENHAASLQSTIEASYSSHIDDAQRTAQLLEGCLMQKKQLGGSTETFNGSEVALHNFRQHVKNSRAELEAIQLQEFHQNNAAREEFVKRWAC